MSRISWKAIEPFGAAIDLDLSARLAPEQLSELRSIYRDRGLLVFEGQSLSYPAQLEIGAWFGRVIAEKSPSIVSPDPKVGSLGHKELAFHSDLACAAEPLEAISLHALDVDDGQSETWFVETMAVLDRLPAPLRRRLNGLSALHLWPTVANSSARKRGSGDVPDDWPGATHPVLFTHPQTGGDILFLNAGQTERIVGLAPDESEDLIETVFGYLYDPRFRYAHPWKAGDFVLWDNMRFQHGRPAIRAGVRRNLQRVAMGSRAYVDEMPPDFRATYAAIL